jgi:HAD superfamily hydrolase (TIGR01509 family)
MHHQAVIFDVDGVIVDSPHERAWREALGRLMTGPWAELGAQIGYTPARFSPTLYAERVAGRPRRDGAAAALAALGIADLGGARAAVYAAAKQDLLAELIERGEFAIFPDARRLLLALRAAGVKLAAASSSQNANTFLARAPGGSLLGLFDVNLCGVDVGPGKPDPAIFLAAAAALKLPPAACLVVEDAVSGVRAARAATMACIGVARLGDSAQLRAAGADPVVTSLDSVDLADL